MVPLILDSAGIAEDNVWAIASAVACAYVLVMLLAFAFPQGRAAGVLTRSNHHLAYLSLAVQVIPLLVNAIWLRAAWPFLVVQLFALAISVASFARLLTSPR